MAAKTLLERALLPSLLAGSCNWTGVRKETEEACDELIYLFWRCMFKVPESTPKIGLIAETSTIRTKWRIWTQKLMLVKRLQNKNMSVLARQIYEKQLKLGLPGLAKEVTVICDKISIPDINFVQVKKDKIEGNKTDKAFCFKNENQINFQAFIQAFPLFLIHFK